MTTLYKDTATLPSLDEQLLAAVKGWGSPISILLLNSPCRLFRHPQGVIGFQLIRNCAVVIGDPLCVPQSAPALAQAFHDFCQIQNWNTLYFLASEAFAHWAINRTCRLLLQVGQELHVNPTNFQVKHKLRWCINHSHQQGVVIKEYVYFDASIEKQINRTIAEWQSRKYGFQLYLETLDLFKEDIDKRIFYALHENKIVGVLTVLRIDRRQGWTMTSVLALEEAPVGVTEHLMSHVIELLGAEKCPFLCLGFVSGTKIGEMVGLNHFSKFFTQLIFGLSRKIFPLDGRRVYLNKYHPVSSPTYILCSTKLGINELIALKNTLNFKICL